MPNEKGWFDQKTFPFLSRFVRLSRSEQDTVVKTQTTRGTDAAVRLVRMFGGYGEDARLYELPQAAYATVMDVRQRIGANAASIVESVFAGDANSLEGMDPDEQRLARALASLRGLQLP